MRLLTDNPVRSATDDRYGFERHATMLSDALESVQDLPLTVGVYGPWGSGKSSFINICRDVLVGRGLPVVSFNPWKYDQRDDVWHALIQSVLDEIAAGIETGVDTAEPDRREKLKDTLARVKALSRSASWLATRKLLGLVTAGVISSGDADKLLEAWQSAATGEPYRHMNRFESDFRDVVTDFTDGGRLIVFIDDLDRCTPEAAVTVLDAIKLFLGEASCVFVLAMDQDMIVEAVAHRLGCDQTRARLYLEKLVHFPYHLPAVRFESLYASLRSEVIALSDDEALWEMIQVAFGPNPRRVRRFVNALNLTTSTLRQHSEPTNDRLLQAALLLALRFQFPTFYSEVVADPSAWSGETVRDPSLEKFLAATHPRRQGFRFPPPPDGAFIAVLTDTLALAATAVGEPTTAPEDR